MKIRTKERVEPPHVTIIQGTRSWRYNIRRPGFMDRRPPPREVPEEVVATISENLAVLRKQWDDAYPENPVRRGGKD